MLLDWIVCVELLCRRLVDPLTLSPVRVSFSGDINLYWGLLNLVPVLPLDGGHIVHSLLQILRVRDPDSLAMKVGAVAAGLAAYYFFDRAKNQFMGIMMLMLCVQNVAALQSRR